MRHLRKFSVRLTALVVLFTSFVFVPPTSAQNKATLEVSVFDPTEAAVTDAAVALQSSSSSAEPQQQPSSAANGRYRFNVAPGR